MAIDDYVKHFPRDKLQTGIAHFEHPGNKKKVELVSCMHVGTKNYYENILAHLGGCDVVLYELFQLNERPVQPIVRQKAGAQYAKVARALERQQERFLDKIEANIKKEDCSADREAQLDLIEKMRRLVCVETQGQGIPYHSLPENWFRADSSLSKVVEHFGLFSCTLFKFICIGAVAQVLFSSDRFADYVAHSLMRRNLPYKDLLSEVAQLREQALYKMFSFVEKCEDKIGIFYGAMHAPRIEAELFKRGYERKGIDYLTVLKFIPDINDL